MNTWFACAMAASHVDQDNDLQRYTSSSRVILPRKAKLTHFFFVIGRLVFLMVADKAPFSISPSEHEGPKPVILRIGCPVLEGQGEGLVSVILRFAQDLAPASITRERRSF